MHHRSATEHRPWWRAAAASGICVALAACSSTTHHAPKRETPAAPADPDHEPSCGATPRTLLTADELVGDARAISAAMDLAVDGEYLFVAVNYDDGGAILRVPLAGGPSERLARLDGMEQALLLVGDDLVFSEVAYEDSGEPSARVARISRDGGPIETLASAAIEPANIVDPFRGLSSDDGYLYFAATDGAMRVSLSGGEVERVSEHTGSLTLIDDDLWIADGNAGELVRVPAAGGVAITLTTELSGDLGPITSCGDATCWASSVPGECCAVRNGTITRLEPDGTEHVFPDEGMLGAVSRLIYDDGDLLFAEGGDASSGSIGRVSAEGETTFLGSGSGLAIDADCVYMGDVLSGVTTVTKDYEGL